MRERLNGFIVCQVATSIMSLFYMVLPILLRRGFWNALPSADVTEAGGYQNVVLVPVVICIKNYAVERTNAMTRAS